MKSKNLYFLIGALLVVSSCKKTYDIFYVKNNSNKNIYFTYSNLYPDTLALLGSNLGILGTGSIVTPSQIVHPGSTILGLTETQYPINDYFAKFIPSGKLMVFIYDQGLIDVTPWDTVVAKNLIIKRYELSADSLKNKGLVIQYP